MKHIPEIRSLARNAQTSSEFLHWLRIDGGKLGAAAHLLGGPDWAERAMIVVDVARKGHNVATRPGDRRALRKLLHLEYTSDPGSEEAKLFVDIDPDDQRADDARRCAEILDKGVRALEALRLAGVAKLREAA